MEQSFIKELKAVMEKCNCHKGFQCYTCGFENISKTKRFAGKYFTCTGDNPLLCPYSISFGYSHYCTCPLFIYAANELYTAEDHDTDMRIKPGKEPPAITA